MPKVVNKRTCIGCRKKKEKDKLLRVVINKRGSIVFDTDSTLKGRGAYLCKGSQDCLNKAVENKAFKHAFKKEKINQKKVRSIKASKASGSRSFGSC